MQAHREIRQALGVKELSVTDIFRFPVLATLSKRIAKLMGDLPIDDTDLAENKNTKVLARSDAMSKRRAMRAARQKPGAY